MENGSGASRPSVLRLLENVCFSVRLRLSIHPDVDRPTMCIPSEEDLSVDLQAGRRERVVCTTTSRHSFTRSIRREFAPTAVVNEDRRGPRQHIVRVLRGTPLPAFIQVKRGLLVR